MDRLQRLFSQAGGGGGGGGQQGDTPQVDTAEQVRARWRARPRGAAAESRWPLSGVHLLSRAAEDAEARCGARAAAGGAARRTEASALRLRRAGRAGVPMEVMGLMLGEFVDDYTVKVVDVFAMPQVRRQSCPSAREQP